MRYYIATAYIKKFQAVRYEIYEEDIEKLQERVYTAEINDHFKIARCYYKDRKSAEEQVKRWRMHETYYFDF